MKKALITGVTGQDGSYLSRLLLEKGYEVHGIKRRSSSFNTGRIDDLMDNRNFHLHHGDMTDASSLNGLLARLRPDEIYNLAAMSHVAVSFEMPHYTAEVNALGTLNLLEGMVNICPKARLYQASTSEMFGAAPAPQNERTPFMPQSPYAASKVFAHHLVSNYRDAYGLHACSGILFNHESPVRGETFVTRKVIRGLKHIMFDKGMPIQLGNLNAVRDWGHAKDYVWAMWAMLQTDQPKDYVVATGESYSVREFVTMAGEEFGMQIEWQGEGLQEVGYEKRNGRILVVVNDKYFRPAEVHNLRGDSSLIRAELAWEPVYGIRDIIREMAQEEPLHIRNQSR